MTDDFREPRREPEWADPDVRADEATDLVDPSDERTMLAGGPVEETRDGETPDGAGPFADSIARGDDDPSLMFGADSGVADDALPRRPRRKLVTPVTAGLAAVILAAAGFAGGVQVQKGRGGGTATASGLPAGMPSMAGGMPGGAAASGSGAARTRGSSTAGGGSGSAGGSSGSSAAGTASSTSGEVSNVKGGTIYVKKSDGTTVRVVAADGATVQRTAKATMTGVHPGDTVVVSGEADEDGTVAASSVTATADGVTTTRTFGGMGGGPPAAMTAP